MGNKNKKKHKHRSRSRSTERSHVAKKDKKKRKEYSSESSDDASSSTASSSPSPDRKKHKKHKRSRSQEGKRKHSHSTERRKRSKSREKRPKVLNPEEIEKMKEERKKEKELMKALETPEEKRARRMAKKELKERKRKENMGWDDEYMGYTNADNPFGDEHLLDTFVWPKKMEKEGKKTYDHTELQRHQKVKMIENKVLANLKVFQKKKDIELEKVKKRRLEREREMEERERERERLQREKEAEYFREWEMQEDSFHLNQAKLRSKIRIEDSRAKPIDLLGKYINAEDDDFAVEMHEPYTYLNGLTITDLEDLLEDIKVYVELEQDKNVDYWRDITIITEDELEKLRKIDPTTRDYIGERRSGMNRAVADDVQSVFKGKTQNQLLLLEKQILSKLEGGEGVDVGYWESLLGQLKAHMARTRLCERHQEQLRRKLFKLKQEQGIESQPLFPILRDDGGSNSSSPGGRSSSPALLQMRELARLRRDSPSGSPSRSRTSSPGPSQAEPKDLPHLVTSAQRQAEEKQNFLEPPGSGMSGLEQNVSMDGFKAPAPVNPQPGPSGSQEDKPENEGEESVLTEEDLVDQSYVDYDSGSYSPKLLRPADLDPDAILYDPQDDIKRLEYARRRLMCIGKAKEDNDTELVKRAREGMTDDEATFSVEIPLERQTLLWSDKYRPRKPRFFNRVHTGFEWNKYNQTHYDIDNPPPKIVQGYKFNIFFPDLIDKTQTPEYKLTPCEENKDFAVLRFHAGPPYEDIAFKIVNREWEYSYKRGFRCQFHNNIFQLWFHFKRYRYRR